MWILSDTQAIRKKKLVLNLIRLDANKSCPCFFLLFPKKVSKWYLFLKKMGLYFSQMSQLYQI